MWITAGLLLVALGACADDGASPCELIGDELPSLDQPDSESRWQAIAASLDGEDADAAAALAVVARQVGALGPDASFEERAAVALRPAVADHLATIERARVARCDG